MWRRPNSNGFQYDYWDKIEPMFPAILYYFPNTIWKSIISKRLIPFLPKIYCAAANYGFRYIHFELDFEVGCVVTANDLYNIYYNPMM